MIKWSHLMLFFVADWYYGYSLKNPAAQGLFPASHTEVLTYEQIR